MDDIFSPGTAPPPGEDSAVVGLRGAVNFMTGGEVSNDSTGSIGATDPNKRKRDNTEGEKEGERRYRPLGKPACLAYGKYNRADEDANNDLREGSDEGEGDKDLLRRLRHKLREEKITSRRLRRELREEKIASRIAILRFEQFKEETQRIIDDDRFSIGYPTGGEHERRNAGPPRRRRRNDASACYVD